MLSSALASDIASSHVVGLYFPSLTTKNMFGTLIAYSRYVAQGTKPSMRQKRVEIIMFTEPAVMAHTSRNGAIGRQLLLSFIALFFALTIYPSKAHAQIIGELEANIPFQFHAGNIKLPAGKYVIHMLDDSNLTIMEITSADGSTSALFEVHEAEANSAPAKSELIFNKYGNRYFLAKLFDEGNPGGNEVAESRYEKMVSKAAAEAQIHVATHHRGQHGN